MTKTFALGWAVLVILSGTASVQAAELVSGFVGDWLGQGSIRQAGFDKPRKIRCQVEGRKTSDLQVSFSGRCATTSGAGEFRLLIAQDQSGQNVAAKVQISSTLEQIDFSGTAENNRISLFQTTPVKRGNRVVTSELSLVFLDDGLNLENNLTDLASGDTSVSLSLTFSRQ